MHLLRTLSFFIVFFNIDLTIEHIAGVKNCAADMLSRNSVSDFFLLCPQVSRIPTPVPLPLFPLLTPQGMDWTSLTFGTLFKAIITIVQHNPLNVCTRPDSKDT